MTKLLKRTTRQDNKTKRRDLETTSCSYATRRLKIVYKIFDAGPVFGVRGFEMMTWNDDALGSN